MRCAPVSPSCGSGLIARRAAGSGPEIGRAAKQIDAGAQRRQPILRVRAGKLHARLELFLRRAPHRVRRQRGNALERRERRLAALRRRMDRQHFPDEEHERIVGRRRERAVERVERLDQAPESGGH